MNKFIGRKQELSELQGLLKKKSSSLVVIKGRRRIGKSRLAEEFSKSFTKSYFLTGLAPEQNLSAQSQKDDFARQMKNLRIPTINTSDWGDLFTDLAIHTETGRVLIVLDEITWMGDKDPTFLPKLKTVWDTLFKKNTKLILLISGSNSVWIEKNLLSSTGFVGRISYQLHLRELPLKRCSEFLSNSSNSISAYEKLKLLSVTGGIPRYLEEIRLDLSAEQNIYSLCYKRSGALFNEFDQIFSDLFSKRNSIYKEIITELSKGKLTLNEIIHSLGRSKGGDFSFYLKQLVEVGFVEQNASWNIQTQKEERRNYYRICDNYIRFYLRYIEPYKSRISKNKVSSLPSSWKSILGIQFESLVLNNEASLIKLLGLNYSEVVWSGPYYQSATTRREGCQIDLLIQTKHQTLYVCEIKFLDSAVPLAVKKEVSNKLERLKVPKGFSIRNVLIHVNGVSESLKEDDFFSNIINFSEFLE